ncbi:hypothetical protein Tco_1372572 [Tanacetum coccineum]
MQARVLPNCVERSCLNDKYIKKNKMKAAMQRILWDPRIKSAFQDITLRTRLWLKDHQDAMEKLARQQVVTFQALFDTLRAELQATRGLLQNRQAGGDDQGVTPPKWVATERCPRALLHEYIAQDMRERPLNVSFEK